MFSESLPDINFRLVRPAGEPASRPGGFEELASVLMQQGAVQWPEGVRFERFGNPDGGRDGRGVLPNGDVWAWQVKYLDRFGESAVGQVWCSVQAALACEPRLRRYFVVFPIDLPAGDTNNGKRMSAHERWRSASERWAAEARTKDMNVEFVFVGAHELSTALTSPRHAGLIRYWFGEYAPGAGTTDYGEAVAAYLRRLVEAMDADPWPREGQSPGPVLSPSQIERKLRVSRDDGMERDDADELCGRCSRLVIIGDSGTGKTWLARRAARRCAEAALDRLQAGVPVAEVELPVFTTCARLAEMPAGDDIRDAIVGSAWGQLPDLGRGGLAAEVRALLVKRDGPTLVVLDSLDEAAGRDKRVGLAESLPPGWRVILTSRPSSWNGQLNVTGGDPSRQQGTLLPLRYPGDVEPFIASWFKDRPELGADLAAQIRGRPELQEAATVPLILAFYCIIAGRGPLPARTPELYNKVISRMLAGRWRGSPQPVPGGIGACLSILCAWAWEAAANDPVSGAGRWHDEIVTDSDLDPAVREALDHVAVPQGPPDPDDVWRITRRFAHRSIQEHLVARYVASLTAGQAAERLVGHLWFDEDWAPYALPAAIAMHPQREQVLSLLAQRVTGSSNLPGEILALDGRYQISALLARVALHTAEADWSAAAAALITEAMRRLHGKKSLTWVPSGWPSFSELLVQVATRQLEAEPPQAQHLRQIVAGPVLGLVGRERVLGAVLRSLALASPQDVLDLASLVPQLNPSAAERAEVRAQVKRVLSGTCCRYYLSRPGWQPSGTKRLLLPDPENSPAYVLAELAVSGEEQAQAADELIALLGRCAETRAEGLSAAIGTLGPSAAQRQAAGNILLARLPAEHARWDVVSMSGAIASLCRAPAQRAAALQVLTESIVSPDAYHVDSPEMIAEISELITDLAGDDHGLGRARAILAAAASREAASGSPREASALACLVAKLEPTDGERALLEDALLTAISAQASAESALQLAEAGLAVAQASARQDLFRRKALEATAALCAGSPENRSDWERIFGDLLFFAETPAEHARCLDLIVDVLAREDIDDVASASGELFTALADSPGDLERLRAVLLARLEEAGRLTTVTSIAWALKSPALGSETRERLRAALVGKIDDEGERRLADRSRRLIGMTWRLIGDLSTTEADKAKARRMLLKFSCETGNDLYWRYNLTREDLRSLAADIDALQIQPCYLTNAMLTLIRQTSPLDTWLTALPMLCAPQRQAPHARGAAMMPGTPLKPACPLGLETRHATPIHPKRPQTPG